MKRLITYRFSSPLRYLLPVLFIDLALLGGSAAISQSNTGRATSMPAANASATTAASASAAQDGEQNNANVELPPGITLASVRLGTFSRQLKLVGDVEARKQAYLSPSYNTKVEMLAEDGATVKKGAVVARLDVKTIEEDLDEQVLELEVARSALVEHDRTTSADKVRLDAEIQRAISELDQKSLALSQLEAGTRPEELRKLKLNLDQANRARELSRSTLALKEKLAAKGISTQLEVLQARLDLTNKERDSRVAEAEHQQGLRGATPLARQLARVERDKARGQVAWARQNRALTLEQAGFTRQKLVAKQGNVSARVNLLKQQMQQATLKAPINGTVVLTKAWTNEGLKRVSVGDDVQEGSPIMTVADLSAVVIKSELDETLLREVKPGMPVSIQLPSLRNRRFTGKVERIGVLAHEVSGRQNTAGLNQVFDLHLVPDKQDAVFQPGTSVDIQLPLSERKGALMLPRRALWRDGARHYVLMPDGSERDVKLGEANDVDVIISSGLSVGEKVRIPEGAVKGAGKDDSKEKPPLLGGDK